MNVVFSEHAEEQLRRRNIPKIRVKKTIQDYDEMITSFRSRKLRRKSFDDKILEVITRREGNKIIIITAYYLKGEI